MNIASEQSRNEFKSHMVKILDSLNIELSGEQMQLMVIHSHELALWNKKINLTAIKTPLQVAEKHFIDSIIAASFLAGESCIIDMGSGGGFPGIPLKIMNPLLRVVLIDSSRKKVNFLKHLIRTLGLDKIEAIHSRAEDLHENAEYKNQFDAVISRAFADLPRFVELSLPFLSQTGKIYAMKGKNLRNEITPELLKKFNLKLYPYKLPFEKSDRVLIRLQC